MAFEVDFAGLEEIKTMLLKNAEAAEKHAEPILLAGSEVLANAMKSELTRVSKGKRSTGELAKSIKVGRVKRRKKGNVIHTDVFPEGYQNHSSPGFGRDKNAKVSNRQVGFMLEYGTSKMLARPWASVAEHKSADAVNEAMAKEWEKVSYG